MLRIQNLYKSYGKFRALDNLNLTIEKGQLFGFVGPNGAGKTTTMKIIAGLISANSGEVYVGDTDILKNIKVLKEKIGYVPDFFGVYDNLKVIEYMEFYASIYGMEGKRARKECFELLDLVKLSDKAEEYVDHLSRGMKQKLCLARSIVHKPELLILDEPASGLDPRARFEMKEILKTLKEAGNTILISSHILPELVQMCTDIGIINNGQMVATGSVEEILNTIQVSKPLVIHFQHGVENGIAVLKNYSKVNNIIKRENCVSVIFAGNSEDESKLLTDLVSAGAGICSYTREEGSLEELFLKITDKEGIRDEDQSSIQKRVKNKR